MLANPIKTKASIVTRSRMDVYNVHNSLLNDIVIELVIELKVLGGVLNLS